MASSRPPDAAFKSLVIAVQSYPYGYGDPFLQSELEVLHEFFDRIVLVPDIASMPRETPLFRVPPKTFVMPVALSRAQLALWSILASRPHRLVHVFTRAIRDARLATVAGTLRATLAFAGRVEDFAQRFEEALNDLGLPREGLHLYSYWFDEHSDAFAHIRNNDPRIRAFSRAHGYDLYFERHSPAHLPFRAEIAARLDRVFTVSDHGRRYLLQKSGVPEDRIRVSRLGTEPGALRLCDPLPDTVRLLSVAFIAPVKNLELMIEAVAALRGGPGVEWHHVGGVNEGPGTKEYVEKIRQMVRDRLDGKDAVRYRLHGTKTPVEIRAFLSHEPIDLFVNTSHSEGLPVSIMEAMSYGLPVVAPSVGGIPEILHDGVNGFLLPASPGVTDVVAAVRRFHAMTFDEKQRMRHAAFQTWEREFDPRRNYSDLARAMLGGNADKVVRTCTRCVLDTRDYAELDFDARGVCNVCRTYDDLHRRTVTTGSEGHQQIEVMLAEIKASGRGRPHDCLIGISGGVDSTYLAYLAKQWGLRPLVLHVDNGWDAELAVSNIEQIVRRLGFELYTHVVDWSEMRDLQLAFFKASVVDIDIPTDNTYIASIYMVARKFGIKHVLTGHNTVTEGWLPPNFNHYKYDMLNVRAIHRQFGRTPLKTLPLIGPLGLWYNSKVLRIRTHSPLNAVRYDKAEAKQIIRDELGWRDYGSKHFENLFTRFYQGYILPEKFGIDKRRAHVSTLVCSGQLSRDQALRELEQPRYDEATYRSDREYFIKKLGLTEAEFGAYMRYPPVAHTAYPSYLTWFRRARPMVRFWRKLRNRR